MHAPRSSRSCWRSDKPRQPHGNDTNNSTNKNSKRSNRTAVHRARVAPTGVLVIAFLCLLSMSCQEVSAQCTTTCEAGEKCVGSDCAECDPGTFQDANDHMQTTCKTCMNAYQPNSGQAGCIEFASCGRGKKFVTGTTTTPSTCANCDAGTYQDQSGHFDPDCKPCTGNTFTDQPGQQGCSAWSSCNQGQKWAAGSADADATCSSCTPGTYQNEFSHQHTSCKGCGAGTFQSGHGASGCDDWKTCGKGKKWATGTSTTDATCSPCGSFHYQSKSSHKDTSCTSWSTCGPGYEVTVEPTASNDRLCAMCDYGHYQDGTNQQDCKPCDPGQHQDERGQIECKACGAGKYQKSSGQKDCIAYSTCDRGERWVSGTKTKDSSCRSCDIGKYQNFLNHQRTSCKTCPDGKYQLNTGRGSCPDCTTCEDGFEEVLPCTPTSDRTCEDNDPPTIVLRRPDNNAVITNTYTVEAGLPFDPPIFTATDTAAGTVTKTPPPNLGDIDTSTVRSDQMLTYKATDANMNTATRTITVVVVDTTGPAITFDPAVLQLEAGEEVMRSNFTVGVSIVDRVDGTLGIDLLEYDASDVNVNTLGMYEVVYTLSAPDSNNNEAPPTTRTAAVVDTLPPVITIGFGDRNVSEHNVVIHEAATEFILPSQSAFDTFDTAVNGGDVRRNEEPTFNSVVDDDTQFTFTYTATDASDNTAMVVYVIEVRDTMAPTITISGEHNITHEAGTEYVDAGATATDLLEDAIGRGVEVVVANNVLSKPPSVPAVFTVEYDACDKAGNCDAINRTVHVLDRTAPSIELIGDALLVVEAGSNFSDIDPGVTLADLYYDNADLTLVIDDGGYEAAPTATPVSFNVTYTVTDPSRNTASVTRTITIIDTTPPDLRVNGNLSVTVGDGVTWVEPGIARAYDIVDRDVRSRVVATTQLEEAGVVVPTMCAYSSARAFVPPLSPRVWSSPRMDAVESRAPSGTVYRINYTVADAASNVAFVERVVRVADPTPPSLQLLGDRVQALEYGPDAAFVEADGGAVSADAHDGDLSGDVCVGVSIVTRDASGVVAPGDVGGIGEDAINYVLSLARNASTTTAPRPTTSTAATTPMNADTSNSSNSSSTATTTTAAGTTAADMFGLDAAVASAEVGTVYVLQYSVHDRAGNAAVGVQRAVVVVDTTPPEVTLYGAEEVHVLYATRYVEAGYSAQDVHDGNVTLQVVVSGAEAIDVHVAGTYEVEYAVTDANGNTGVAVRTVVVEALMRPERADQVVELVLAGTAESIFGGDVQQLERDLEEALNVDFVVVFLVYDKALGRPTTDINTVPQQQQGRKRRRSSGGSSRDSDNNDNNYSDSDNAWIRGRRGLLAQPSTVVEFGVRNGTSLEWVPAEGVAATLTEIRRAGSSSLPISSARSTGDEAEAGLPLPIIIGAAAGGIVLIVLIAVLVSRRRRSKAAPASISGGMFPFQHSGTFQESIYTVAGEGATVPMQEINFGKQRAAQQSYNHNHSQYPPPPPTNGGDLYGTPTNLPVVNGMVDGQVSESSLYHVPGHPEEVLAGRKTLVLQQGVNGGLPGAVSTDGDGELYDTPRSKPRVPDKAGSMRGAPVTADDYYGSLVHPGQRNHAMSNAGAGAGTDVDGQDMYDVPRNKPRVPEKSASIRKAAEALGDDYYGSLMHPDQQNGSMSNASVGGVGGEMYDVPRSKPRVPEKSASIRGTVTADDFYGSLVHPGQRSSSVNNADGNGNGDDGDMYDVPRNNPRVPSRAQAATATASVAESGVDDQEMYDVPRSAPRLPERTATMTSRATISGDGAEQPEDQELYDTPRAAPRPKPRMVLEQADAGDAVTDDQEMYDVPRSKPRPQPRPRKPTLTLDTNEYSALPTARPTNPSAPSSTNDVARGLPMQETGEELSWSERSRTLRRPPRTDNRVLDMFSSGDGGDGGGGGGGDHVDSSATGRRPTARSRPLTSGDDDPMRVQARALPGYIGEANRMLAEQKLAGSALGTYLWRVSASRAGAVLSVVGSRRTVHHMFTQDASGMILMNDKPLSQPCYDLQSAVALLHSHQEQMSSQLTTPLAQAPRRVVADTHTWLLPGLDRAAAKALLHDTPDGTFVVTPTDSSHFTLFLSYNFDVSSHRLSYGSHGWVLRQQFVPATTLEECVAALHDASYGLPCVLTGPPHQDAMA